MANWGRNSWLEGLRGVDTGEVAMMKAKSIWRLKLPDKVVYVRFVLEAVDDESLEENDSSGLWPFQLSPAFCRRVFVAQSEAVLVMQPNAERVFEPFNNKDGDDEEDAEKDNNSDNDWNLWTDNAVLLYCFLH